MGIPKWKTKNLLGIESLSKIEIRKVLSLAKKLKHESPENQSYLAGKRIVNLFMENQSEKIRITLKKWQNFYILEVQLYPPALNGLLYCFWKISKGKFKSFVACL